MTTTAERPTQTKRPAQGKRMSRDQAADELLKILTNEPEPVAGLRRKVFGSNVPRAGSDVINAGLGVLEARQEARRIPRGPGQRGGWVLMASAHDSAIIAGEKVAFPYKWASLPIDKMFIDKSYQRPLSSLVDTIVAKFDPVLFQTLAINDRGKGAKPFAVIDGQTRWTACTRMGIGMVPCILFEGLTIEEEADMFARLQTGRRGMLSWHRFRAELRAKKPMQVAIAGMVASIGFELGDGVGQLKAVAALEKCYKSDPDNLERALSDFKDAWPKEIPEAGHIKGLHYLLRNYPILERKKGEIDDPRLVRRLKGTSPDSLKRKMLLIKEAGTVKGNTDKLMGVAIENAYSSGGRN